MAWLQEVRWGFWAGLMVFLAIITTLFWGSWTLLEVLEDESQVPVQSMIVQGDLRYTSENDVREALLSGDVGSFFTADVDVLRGRIEQLPWVYSVSVRKEWPARLRIYIVEQKPAAIWNEQRLLNVQGDIFAAGIDQLETDLPALEGPDYAVDEVVHQYRRLSQLLELDDFQVARLQLSERFAVTIWLDNGIELRLGREARLERIQRFVALYPVIQRENDKPVAYVDLRYDTGVAVGWNEQPEVSEP